MFEPYISTLGIPKAPKIAHKRTKTRLFVVGFRISAVRFLDQGMAHSGAPGISGNWETSD